MKFFNKFHHITLLPTCLFISMTILQQNSINAQNNDNNDADTPSSNANTNSENQKIGQPPVAETEPEIQSEQDSEKENAGRVGETASAEADEIEKNIGLDVEEIVELLKKIDKGEKRIDRGEGGKLKTLDEFVSKYGYHDGHVIFFTSETADQAAHVEHRIDSYDEKIKSREQFVQQYGEARGNQLWDNARVPGQQYIVVEGDINANPTQADGKPLEVAHNQLGDDSWLHDHDDDKPSGQLPVDAEELDEDLHLIHKPVPDLPDDPTHDPTQQPTSIGSMVLIVVFGSLGCVGVPFALYFLMKRRDMGVQQYSEMADLHATNYGAQQNYDDSAFNKLDNTTVSNWTNPGRLRRMGGFEPKYDEFYNDEGRL